MRELVWYGNFDQSGYGEWGRKLVYSLMNSGQYKVKVISSRQLDRNDPLYQLQFLEIEREDPIVVWNYIPLEVPRYEKCGYATATEINKPPEEQIDVLEKSKFILALSTFGQERFQKVVSDPEKVFHVNFPYFPGEYTPEGDVLTFNNINDDTFTFLVVARIDVRKNLDTLIKAFAEEFGDNDKVALILKIYSGIHCIPKWINEQEPSRSNTYWFHKRVNKMGRLYRACDAYVCTDIGEGWGGPCTEAMLCGLPTIAPRHSGHLDYMNDENSWLIEVGDWEFIGYHKENKQGRLLPPYRKGKPPIFEDVKRKMREVYEEFKSIPKEERLSHPKIQNALKVQEIVHPKVAFQQMHECFNWVEDNT